MLNNGLVLVGVLLLVVAYVIYRRAVRTQTDLPMRLFMPAFVAGGACVLIAGTGWVQ